MCNTEHQLRSLGDQSHLHTESLGSCGLEEQQGNTVDGGTIQSLQHNTDI